LDYGAADSRTRIATADGRRFRILPGLLIVALLIIPPGCREDPDRARERGRKAGFEEGRRDGERQGYERGFARAFQESLDRRADEVADDGGLSKSPLRLLVFVLVFLVLGFGAQYSATYLLRRGNILRDVDSILLGSRNASLSLRSLDPDRALSPLLGDESEVGFGTTPEDDHCDRG
jgi:hypothetical protein